MQNLVWNWRELPSFYFCATATTPLFFALAPPRRAPPFTVHTSGAVALKVAQVPSTTKQNIRLKIWSLERKTQSNWLGFNSSLWRSNVSKIWTSWCFSRVILCVSTTIMNYTFCFIQTKMATFPQLFKTKHNYYKLH